VVLHVRTLSTAEHLSFLATRDSASFLQTPAWGQAKREWRSESIGWIDEQGEVVGAGLALYRQLPRVPRSLAYLPEGPVIDWSDPDLSRWLKPRGSRSSSVPMIHVVT
jgi:lipid II:glycine glycyltransferase (peptidoglycan interpeptide bridge formation enzyme)